MGWRMPSLPELSSLIDPTQTNPALPQGHPFIIPPRTGFWSATTYAGNPSFAWVVIFENTSGYVFSTQKDSTIGWHVWCVRGAMNADAY